ncbi:MAG: helix-turn-helix domain-containing protein [Oscillospiraceae bacterium]|jgi:transcriptional regulator with XRE-family HTH domain|nr:helix-turn-helix domain-containing protein [Oscillospiraceae bacterium]
MENAIGKNIAALRKERGVRQEELAKAVGISAQAVSKWEVGGTPDVEILPKIADFFGVSTDALFGRDSRESIDIETEFFRKFLLYGDDEPTFEKALALAFDYAWRATQAIVHKIAEPDSPNRLSIDDFYEKTLRDANVYEQMRGEPAFSEVDAQNGLLRVRLNAARRYFLLMPKPQGGWDFGDTATLSRVFADFADADFLNTVLYFHRNPKQTFTTKLLGREFGFAEEKSLALLERLREYQFVIEREITLDGEEIKYYEFKTNPAIVPFLTLTEEMARVGGLFLGRSMLTDRRWLK